MKTSPYTQRAYKLVRDISEGKKPIIQLTSALMEGDTQNTKRTSERQGGVIDG